MKAAMQKNCRTGLLAALLVFGTIIFTASMAQKTSYVTTVSYTTFTPPPIEISTTDTQTVYVSQEPTTSQSVQPSIPSPFEPSETSEAVIGTRISGSLSSIEQPTTTLGTTLQRVSTSTVLPTSAEPGEPSETATSVGARDLSQFQLGAVVLFTIFISGSILAAIYWALRKRSDRRALRSRNVDRGAYYLNLLRYFYALHRAAEPEPELGYSHQELPVRANAERMLPRDELAGVYGGMTRPKQAHLEADLEAGSDRPSTPPIPMRSPLRLVSSHPVRPTRPVSVTGSLLRFMDRNSADVSAELHPGVDIEMEDFSLRSPPPAALMEQTNPPAHFI